MKVEWINPFLRAANRVLTEMVNLPAAQIGKIGVDQSPYTTQEITAMLGVQGALRGTVLLGMSSRVAESIVERMVGEPTPLADALAQSALGELGNMISGAALASLESAGYNCTITPPVVIRGGGAVVATMPQTRLVVPIVYDDIAIQLAVSLSDA